MLAPTPLALNRVALPDYSDEAADSTLREIERVVAAASPRRWSSSCPPASAPTGRRPRAEC